MPVPVAAPHRQENGARKQTLTDRLTESREFDPDATNDDRIMAALAYASQLIFPLGFVLPRHSADLGDQQEAALPALPRRAVARSGRDHLDPGLHLHDVLDHGGLHLHPGLCCASAGRIALWLLPLYYAMLAYNGKRFRIRGLTQFLEDQRWL